jgi:tRNA-dihydrouridine synthase A
VTVKHRIGIDDIDRYEDMARFVAAVAAAGCDRFSVHARKAWLSGLSPKGNRSVPPLRYGEVYRLKREHPELAIEINGGVADLDAAAQHLAHVDAVMIGRAAYDDPYLFATTDARFFADPAPPPTRREVVEGLIGYAAGQIAAGALLKHVARHALGLFAGRPGARAWKRHLAENAHLPGAGPEVLRQAMEKVPAHVLDERPAA